MAAAGSTTDMGRSAAPLAYDARVVTDGFDMGDHSGECCLFGISLGQEYHKSDKLSAAAALFKSLNFGSLVCMVADSLQAYMRLADQFLSQKVPADWSVVDVDSMLGEERAREHLSGSAFVTTNRSTLSGFTIIRWDDLLRDEGFRECRERLDEFYSEDSGFSFVVDVTAGTFFNQHVDKFKKQDDFDRQWFEEENKQRILKLFRDYLLEELAVLLLWMKNPEKYPYNFTAYPRVNSLPVKYVLSNFQSLLPPDSARAFRGDVFLRELVYQFRKRPKVKIEKVKKITKSVQSSGGGAGVADVRGVSSLVREDSVDRSRVLFFSTATAGGGAEGDGHGGHARRRAEVVAADGGVVRPRVKRKRKRFSIWDDVTDRRGDQSPGTVGEEASAYLMALQAEVDKLKAEARLLQSSGDKQQLQITTSEMVRLTRYIRDVGQKYSSGSSDDDDVGEIGYGEGGGGAGARPSRRMSGGGAASSLE